MSKIIVVGANHAGTACINTILDQNQGHEVVVFDSNFNISFLGCGIALWVGKQIDGSDGLFYSNPTLLSEKGAKIHMETMVDAIDYEKKIVKATGKDGTVYEESYDKLVLATGSLPIIPKVSGSDLENIQQIKLFQDAQAIMEKLDKDPSIKTVTVVGAGYIGVELAEAFQLRGKTVHLVDMADSVLPSYYDSNFTALMTEHMKKNGVNLHLSQTVTGFEGESRVTAVNTTAGTIQTDMVIWGIGFVPNNALGKDSLKLFRNGAFEVDSQQKTSVDDVYAIGDCATVFDNSREEKSYIALATNAVRSGIIAAHNVCGTKLETQGVQGSNAISIYGLNMVSTGLTMAKAKEAGFDPECSDFSDNQRPEFMKKNAKVDLRVVFDKKTRRVLGAQMASEFDMSGNINMFSLAIQEKCTIDRLKLLDIFFMPHFNKPYNYLTMAAITAPDT